MFFFYIFFISCGSAEKDISNREEAGEEENQFTKMFQIII